MPLEQAATHPHSCMDPMQAFSVSMVRKHARTDMDQDFHYGPAVPVVSGNHVTGRRRGIVDGIDFQATGSGDCSHI